MAGSGSNVTFSSSLLTRENDESRSPARILPDELRTY